ncbi:hypothetical protein KX928_07055 [Roseobacter sp. YSTF-M11]|uniref:Uncharacterized protein n=1 Tax=Roseobacter insulae TaxID=2859783 RepID=A0A9X1FTI6_9RHOB|nr:hypothetical protein [Roseobacter insulae]MBW4707540.1 hypothetical protein [Roseobacter insulae]
MSDLTFLITNGFSIALEQAGKLGPRAASKAKLRIFGLIKYLRGVENSWSDADHLRWSHVEQAHHVKKDYPPAEFGAFLAGLERPLLFHKIEGLDDPDPQGYFARFRSRKFELACFVVYVEQPDRRLVFLSVGTLADSNRKLAAMADRQAARQLISEVRALPKPERRVR